MTMNLMTEINKELRQLVEDGLLDKADSAAELSSLIKELIQIEKNTTKSR